LPWGFIVFSNTIIALNSARYCVVQTRDDARTTESFLLIVVYTNFIIELLAYDNWGKENEKDDFRNGYPVTFGKYVDFSI
jgi:hypothetical protein